MITLTKDELRALKPCDPEERMKLFGRRKRMNAKQALEAGATIRDLLWVAMRLGRRDLCVKFALACAQRVAHLNPDPRVQGALDATQAWLDDPSEANLSKVREARRAAAAAAAADAAYAAAADAAYAAAYAAYAAAYAAYAAAYAAADAAYAAADAADAAAAAAAAAADAAYAAREREQAEQQRIFLEIFG